ncbi:MAG: enoyl-CoA hydratase/isomerase family protein [Flammeovirgaceae bacterium]|nr:MAG: enoyl-CoA hydratase/isomerase family protein [Flammeovirgaceae bacterium]
MNTLLYSISNRIASITLNRPDKRNALNNEIVSELTDAFNQAEQDDRVNVIILKAAGEAFCAGADLSYLQQLQKNSLEENLADSTNLKNLYRKIYTLSKPVIAQVQGHALAGGCGLATVCDFCFSVPEAKFGYTEVKIGFIPAVVMVFLIRKIGDGKARQLLLSGDAISADEALEKGLITRIVQQSDLEKTVLDFAGHLVTTNSATSMKITKQMIAEVQNLPLDAALNYAANMNAQARATDDCKRGIAAFLNKEKILW